MAAIDRLFTAQDLTPHGFCLLWDPGLIWLHFAADSAIALAYLAIPAALAVVGRRRPDLNPFGVLYWFAAFIILCAATHLIGIVTLWQPWYLLAGAIKLACAIVSIVTAALVWRILRFVLAVPSQAEMLAANQELRHLNEVLEERVADRTAELTSVNERLVAAVYGASQADRIKADFLARMSHELRTPLNAIIGFCEMLLAGIGGELRDRHRAYCESIHAASKQLLDQINNVLDFDRHGHEATAAAPRLNELAGLCEDAAGRLQAASQSAGVAVVVEVPPNLGVWADAQALRTILSNLISNAIKYSPRGTRVVVQGDAGADGVTVRVSDRGLGVDADDVPRLFEPFFRAHERTLPAVGGSGLGLTMVKLLVDSHGGRIDFHSRRNAGTTVSVWLPSEPSARVGAVPGVLGPSETDGFASGPLPAQP